MRDPCRSAAGRVGSGSRRRRRDCLRLGRRHGSRGQRPRHPAAALQEAGRVALHGGRDGETVRAGLSSRHENVGCRRRTAGRHDAALGRHARRRHPVSGPLLHPRHRREVGRFDQDPQSGRHVHGLRPPRRRAGARPGRAGPVFRRHAVPLSPRPAFRTGLADAAQLRRARRQRSLRRRPDEPGRHEGWRAGAASKHHPRLSLSIPLEGQLPRPAADLELRTDPDSSFPCGSRSTQISRISSKFAALRASGAVGGWAPVVGSGDVEHRVRGTRPRRPVHEPDVFARSRFDRRHVRALCDSPRAAGVDIARVERPLRAPGRQPRALAGSGRQRSVRSPREARHAE